MPYGTESEVPHAHQVAEDFHPKAEARATRQGGAGLGLAIAREIVDAHNGTTSGTSEGGVTRFVVKILAVQ